MVSWEILISNRPNSVIFLWILKIFIFLKRKLSPLELRKPGLLFFMRISSGIGDLIKSVESLWGLAELQNCTKIECSEITESLRIRLVRGLGTAAAFGYALIQVVTRSSPVYNRFGALLVATTEKSVIRSLIKGDSRNLCV